VHVNILCWLLQVDLGAAAAVIQGVVQDAADKGIVTTDADGKVDVVTTLMQLPSKMSDLKVRLVSMEPIEQEIA
jgi:hypothetical protein